MEKIGEKDLREHIKADPALVPEGLEIHCDACGLVVPSDAPRSEAHDCAHIARHKLAYFNAKETVPAQHVMAVACWAMIHDPLFRSPCHRDHAAAREYQAEFVQDRKAHFAKSASRAAMTDEQVAAGKMHARDRHFV